MTRGVGVPVEPVTISANEASLKINRRMAVSISYPLPKGHGTILGVLMLDFVNREKGLCLSPTG